MYMIYIYIYIWDSIFGGIVGRYRGPLKGGEDATFTNLYLATLEKFSKEFHIYVHQFSQFGLRSGLETAICRAEDYGFRV